MPDQKDIFGFGDRQTFQADLDRLMMTAFGRGLDVSGFAPMGVMIAMARAVGSVYRQVAEHHHDRSCPCGWKPLSEEDIAMLQSAFETAAARPEAADTLLAMPVMGRA